MNILDSILADVSLPPVNRVDNCVRVVSPSINYIDVLCRLLEQKNFNSSIKPGMQIGIAVGSRGIAGLADIIRIVVTKLKTLGAKPFIFPAMGSHGGANSEGQEHLLHKLGIVPSEIGCEIKSSMETVIIGETDTGLHVHCDKLAWQSDGIIVINRIKPHTSFRGTHESGLVKMLAIGLGKQHGAEICHRLGFESMSSNITSAAEVLLKTGKILLGIGIVENSDHQICHIQSVAPDDFIRQDAKLLELAWQNYPRLPFDHADVLIISEIGKEISGTGFDTNIAGRIDSSPTHITRIAVLNLSQITGGNANGIGRADVTTQKVLDRMSFGETYPNALTSTAAESVKMPMVLPNDLLAIKAAIKISRIPDFTKVKLALIKNTSEIDSIYMTDSLWMDCSDLSNCSELQNLRFNENGNIISPNL